MVLNLLSFFVGLILLMLIAIVLMNHKKDKKLNGFFLIILAIAGIQRFTNGLQVFEIIESAAKPFQSSLLFSFFIPPIYYLFFDNLLFRKISKNRIFLHVSFPIITVSAAIIFGLDRSTLQAIFPVYSTVYIVFLARIIWENFFKKKNHKELVYFQSNKKWFLIMFVVFVSIYLSANYMFFTRINNPEKNLLNGFYNLTSFVWLFIVIYVLTNPVILYGEQILLEKINKSTKDEIEVWRETKKAKTEKEDIEVEKKVKHKVEEIIFALKKSENELFQNFQSLPTLKELAFQLDYPQSHLKYIFKYYSHCTYGEYQNILKIKYAMKLIRSGYLDSRTIDSLSLECLFTNRSTFFQNFKKLTGYAPTEYQIALAAISKEMS
jgi:AraC-like DNA-binding protein